MNAQEAWDLMVAPLSEDEVVHLIDRSNASVNPGMSTEQLTDSLFSIFALHAKRMIVHPTPENMSGVVITSKGANAALAVGDKAAERAYVDFYFSAAAAPMAEMNDDRKLLHEAIAAVERAIASGMLPAGFHIPAYVCAVTTSINIADREGSIADFERVLGHGRRAFYGLKFSVTDPQEVFAHFLVSNSLGAALIRLGVERGSVELLSEAVTVFSTYFLRAKASGHVRDQFFALMGLGKAHLDLAVKAASDEQVNLAKAKAVLEDALSLGHRHPEEVGDHMADTVLALAKCQQEMDRLRDRVLH